MRICEIADPVNLPAFSLRLLVCLQLIDHLCGFGFKQPGNSWEHLTNLVHSLLFGFRDAVNIQVGSRTAPVSQESLYRSMRNTRVGCKRGSRVAEAMPSDNRQSELLAHWSKHLAIELAPMYGCAH